MKVVEALQRDMSVGRLPLEEAQVADVARGQKPTMTLGLGEIMMGHNPLYRDGYQMGAVIVEIPRIFEGEQGSIEETYFYSGLNQYALRFAWRQGEVGTISSVAHAESVQPLFDAMRDRGIDRRSAVRRLNGAQKRPLGQKTDVTEIAALEAGLVFDARKHELTEGLTEALKRARR